MMPSEDLPLMVQDNLMIKDQWQWSGQNYEKKQPMHGWRISTENHDQAMKVLEENLWKKIVR